MWGGVGREARKAVWGQNKGALGGSEDIGATLTGGSGALRTQE